MEMVWEKQLKDIIVVAGFEVYDAWNNSPTIFSQNLKIRLISQVEEATNSTLYDYSPKLASIPYSDTGLKEKYTFDNFIQGDGNVWAVSAAFGRLWRFGLDL